MILRFSLVLFCVLTDICLAHEQLIVWDVGQGSASTIISNKHCVHFDAGGELNPVDQISDFCKNKTNYLLISHFDFDHYSFLGSYIKVLRSCLINDTLPKKIMKIFSLKRIPTCNTRGFLNGSLRLIFEGLKAASKNNASKVFTWRNRILFPGDSEKEAEKVWSNKIKTKSWFVLAPHHGSHTSSTEELLAKISANSLYIFSARKKRFGHPHEKVLDRLKLKKIPGISTEDWGNIFIQL